MVADNTNNTDDIVDMSLGSVDGADIGTCVVFSEREIPQYSEIRADGSLKNILSIGRFDYSMVATPVLGSADIIVYVIRLVEYSVDCRNIQAIRRLRPLVPIIAISQNDNLDFKLTLFAHGTSDVYSADLPTREVAAKLSGLLRVARSSRMVEAQNSILVRSMAKLRELNSELQRAVDAKLRAEDERNKSEALALASSKMGVIGKITSKVAHELNIPLVVLQEKLPALEKFVLASDGKNALALKSCFYEIRDAAVVMNGMIESLWSFGRRARTEDFAVAKVKDLVVAAVSTSLNLFRNHRVELRVPTLKHDWELPCMSTQIIQVLMNLLSNAHDAAVVATKKWVEIVVVVTDDLVTLKIVDSGKGVPASIKLRLMQPLTSLKSQDDSAGLGLAMCKVIIDGHRGRIYLDEKEMHTTFVVELPRFRDERKSKLIA